MKYVLQSTLIFLIIGMLTNIGFSQRSQLTLVCPDDILKEECCATPTEDPLYGIATLVLPEASTTCVRQKIKYEWINEGESIPIGPSSLPSVEGFTTHDIVIVVSDLCGDVDTCKYSIEITRPELIFEFAPCPSDTVIYVLPGEMGALVEYQLPEFKSTCPAPNNLEITPDPLPASGSMFPLGTTTLSFLATNDVCGEAFCEFSIIVEEANIGGVQCPTDTVIMELYPDSPSPDFGTAIIQLPTATTTCPADSSISVAILDSGNYRMNNDGTFSVVGFQTHTVRFEVSDACDNTDTCTYNITLERPEAILNWETCPMDTIVVFLEDDQTFAQNVYELPTASSNCFEGFEIISDPNNKGIDGQFFPGLHIERYTLTASCAESEFCEIIIDVRTGGPVVEFENCPDDLIKIESFAIAPADDPLYGLAKIEVPDLFSACEFGQEIIRALPNNSDIVTIDGEEYVSGFQTHEVLFLGVGNGCGVVDTCAYTITIERPDTVLMFLNCPRDTTITLAAGETEVVFDYTTPAVGSNCPDVVLQADEGNIGSGGTFPIGIQTESYNVMSACGLISCCFNVIVRSEDSNLMVECPDSFVEMEDPISTGQEDYGTALIEFPMASTNCSDPLVSIELLNEDIVFVEGQPAVQGFQVHDIVFRIEDTCGNTEICSYTIEIVRPELVFEIAFCPEDIVVQVPVGTRGAIVNYDLPQINTNCPDTVGLSTLPPGVPTRGDLFPVGTTSISYVFSSEFCGNATCTFNVVVEEDVSMEEGVDLELRLEAANEALERYTSGDFRLILTNNGSDVATNVAVDLGYDPNEIVPVGNWPAMPSKGTYFPVLKYWQIPVMNPGEIVTLDIKMFAKMAGASFMAEVGAADQMDIDSSPNNAVCCEAMEDDEVFFKAEIIEPPFIFTCPEDFTEAYVLPVEGDDPLFGKAIVVFPEATSTSCANTQANVVLVTTENIGEVNGMTVVEGFQRHELTFLITDECGNSEMCSYTINVTMPNLYHRFAYCPENKIINIPADESSTKVYYSSPVFETNCPETAAVSALAGTPASGSDFPLGTTTISYIAQSACEVDTCSFDVIVKKEEAVMTDLELRLRVNQSDMRPFKPIHCRFTVYNNSDVDAENVQFKLNLQSNYLVQIGHTTAAVSQGAYQDFVGDWNVGTVTARDSANLWVDLFYADTEQTAIYAQITSAMQRDMDSTPSNGACCTAWEDDEIAFPLGTGRIIDEKPESLDFSELRRPVREGADNISAYPNPSSSQLNIYDALDRPLTSFSILDLSGRVLRNETLQSRTNHISIDISALQDGMYYILLNAESVQIPLRFVKN